MKHNLIGDIYRHKTTGNRYEFMGMAVLSTTLQSAVIYRSLNSEIVFVQPATEFFDGRFQFESLINLEDEQEWM